jgi:type IV pilus assembly protein PilC
LIASTFAGRDTIIMLGFFSLRGSFMFSSHLSLSALIELCRVLRHYLGAGLSLEEVFRQQATRGAVRVRPVAGRVADQLKRGESLEDALEREKKSFPPLFLALARVGEKTGNLPEVFSELERYFLRRQELRRRFLAQIAWPALQFFLAIVVISLLILVLGLLNATTPSGQRYDPLGLGLLGPSGALTFLGIVFGTLAGLVLLYWLLRRLPKRAGVDRFLLAIPAIGPCLRDLALSRFCLALRLAHESGMSIGRALRLSLRATNNEAFAAASPTVESTVREGDDITLALTRTHLFPDDMLRIVSVAEASGQLSEVLRHQGDHYDEQASRRLGFLTFLLGCGVWLFVGACIVFTIFRLFSYYLGLIDPKNYGL